MPLHKIEIMFVDALGPLYPVQGENGPEDRQAFLKRVLRAVERMPEAAWEELPQMAQTWYNSNVCKNNTNQRLQEYEDWYTRRYVRTKEVRSITKREQQPWTVIGC